MRRAQSGLLDLLRAQAMRWYLPFFSSFVFLFFFLFFWDTYLDALIVIVT